MFRETKPIIFHERVEQIQARKNFFSAAFSFDEFMTSEHDFHNKNNLLTHFSLAQLN